MLAQRAATGKNSIPDENTDVSVSSHEVEPVNDQVLTAAEDLHSPSIDVAERTLVVAPNDGRPQAQKAVTDRVKSPLPDSSSTGDLHANTRQIASKAWDGINKSLKILQLGQAPLVPPPIEVGENLSDHDDSSGEQHVEEIQLTTKRRRRRKKKAATLGQEQGRQTTLNQWKLVAYQSFAE